MADKRDRDPRDAFLRFGIHRLAHDLPFEAVRRAIAIGLAQPDVAFRGEWIRALRERMRPRFAREGIEQLELDAFMAAREVLASTVGAERVDLVLPGVRLVWSAPEFGKWLSLLFPHAEIDPNAYGKILERIAAISDPAVRARALALLAPLVFPGRETIEIGSGVDDEWARARVVGVLGMRLPGSALRSAVEAAERIAAPEGRALAIGALAPQLTYAMRPTRQLLSRTLQELEAAAPERPKARALIALTPVVRGLFPDLLTMVEQAASAIEPSEARKEVKEAISLPWPQPYIPPQREAASWWIPDAPDASPIAAYEDFGPLLEGMATNAGAVTASTPPMKRAGGEQSAEPSIVAPTQPDQAPTPSPRERIVNLGFANEHTPAEPLPKTSTLAAFYKYVFWVEIGALLKESIVENPQPVLPDEDLPAGARLEVALFSAPGGIQVVKYRAVGELVIGEDGSVRVRRQPEDAHPRDYADLRAQRLVFPVTAPEEEGPARLRCNIYYEGNLVQSHLVTATVTRVPKENVEGALSSVVDYSLTRTLQPRHLNKMPQQQLSVMLNRNADGSHEFMFFGKADGASRLHDFREECNLDADALKAIIEVGRKALRRVAWGDDESWTGAPAQQYRYQGAADRVRLCADLVTLARAGYRMYADLIKDIAGGRERVVELEAIMARHGLVQVALKERAEHVFPAALLYDYAIDTNNELTVCPEFMAALDAMTPLKDARCFAGECDTRKHLNRVCPGGFWGFRHALGLPLSTKHAPEVPMALEAAHGVKFTVLVSTDPLFKLRENHLAQIRLRCAPTHWGLADTRDASFERMRTDLPHLVYFYGHGGLTPDKLPYIEVGKPNSGGGILKDNLVAYRISWKEPQPVVFLNGCNTTALEPEAAFSLVSAFVEDCSAAGVLGTEITIFEPLACRFAEECLRLFFVDKLPIGESVRLARLALLEESNPLGLVYIPFVHAGLRVTA